MTGPDTIAVQTYADNIATVDAAEEMLDGDDETEDTKGLEADVRDEPDTLARGTAVTPSSHRRWVTATTKRICHS